MKNLNIKRILWVFVSFWCISLMNPISAQDTTVAVNHVKAFYDKPNQNFFISDKVQVANHLTMGGKSSLNVGEYCNNLLSKKTSYTIAEKSIYLESPLCVQVGLNFSVEGVSKIQISVLVVFDDKRNPFIYSVVLRSEIDPKNKEGYKEQIIKTFTAQKLAPLTSIKPTSHSETAQELVKNFYESIPSTDNNNLINNFFESAEAIIYNHINGGGNMKINDYINLVKTNSVKTEVGTVQIGKDSSYEVQIKLGDSKGTTEEVVALVRFESNKGRIIGIVKTTHKSADAEMRKKIEEYTASLKNYSQQTCPEIYKRTKDVQSILGELNGFDKIAKNKHDKDAINNAIGLAQNVDKLIKECEKNYIPIQSDETFKRGTWYETNQFIKGDANIDKLTNIKNGLVDNDGFVFNEDKSRVKIKTEIPVGDNYRIYSSDIPSTPFKVTYKYSRWIHVSVGVGAVTLGALIYQFTKPVPEPDLGMPPIVGGK